MSTGATAAAVGVGSFVPPTAIRYASIRSNTPGYGNTLPKAAPTASVLSDAVARPTALDRPLVRAVPRIDTASLQQGLTNSLSPQLRKFEDRFRDVQVVTQPTTSGWTWLFLAWALGANSENRRLETDNAAMKVRMAALEHQLREDPAEWEQLQTLAAPPGATEAQVAATPSSAAIANTAVAVHDPATARDGWPTDTLQEEAGELTRAMALVCLAVAGFVGIVALRSGSR